MEEYPCIEIESGPAMSGSFCESETTCLEALSGKNSSFVLEVLTAKSRLQVGADVNNFLL